MATRLVAVCLGGCLFVRSERRFLRERTSCGWCVAREGTAIERCGLLFIVEGMGAANVCGVVVLPTLTPTTDHSQGGCVALR